MVCFSANPISDQVDWDVTQFADRVKNTHPQENGKPAVEDLNLDKFFRNSELGDLKEPATIVDRFGHIMVWYLPEIFYPFLIVSPIIFYLASENNVFFLGCLSYGRY